MKLQNKAIRIINDVPRLKPITPHYASLGLLKFLGIVKLNACLLFYDHFNGDKFYNLPIASLSELYDHNKLAIPSFRIYSRRFCATIIGRYFWNSTPQFIRFKRTRKQFEESIGLFSIYPNSKSRLFNYQLKFFFFFLLSLVFFPYLFLCHLYC